MVLELDLQNATDSSSSRYKSDNFTCIVDSYPTREAPVKFIEIGTLPKTTGLCQARTGEHKSICIKS